MNLLFVLIFFCHPALQAQDGQAQDSSKISFVAADNNRTEVRIDGQVFTVLNHGSQWAKPFFFPMNTTGGANVLRDIVPSRDQQGSTQTGTDHFHHKGIWIAVDSVNDEKLNFWHEDDLILNQQVRRRIDESSGSLILQNNWMQGPKPLIKEKTTVTFHPSRLVVFRIELSAVDREVTFFDTKEGFLAARVAHTMRQMQGGSIVNSHGQQSEKNCWGQKSPWVDYSGQVRGKTCGITLMDHPSNFRPSRYHVRGYGLFAISPFGPKTYSKGTESAQPVTIRPNDRALTLIYGVHVHEGDSKNGKVADAYQAFLKATQQ